MRIGDLAERSGVNIEAIRYYERIGLIPAPPRSRGGHRVYAARHRSRLVFIRRSRELGFTLDGVRDLLALVDGGHECGDIRNLAAGHLSEIERKIADLQRTPSRIAARGARTPSAPTLPPRARDARDGG